jgi:outer membrane protein OmpA-like peptidoglycan-associated protein
MKLFQVALLSLAAAALVGCGPKNAPSGYDKDGNPIYNDPSLNSSLHGGADGDGLGMRGSGAGENAAGLFDSATGRYNRAAIMSTVYFGFDRYNVDPSERSKLDAIAASAGNTKLIVAGYTDHFGTDQYNLGLSDKRAQSVKNYLVRTGIPEGNIEIQAYGKQYARQSGSKAEVAEDRRVDIVNADYGR